MTQYRARPPAPIDGLPPSTPVRCEWPYGVYPDEIVSLASATACMSGHDGFERWRQTGSGSDPYVTYRVLEIDEGQP